VESDGVNGLILAPRPSASALLTARRQKVEFS
jgi:hypothetical protein